MLYIAVYMFYIKIFKMNRYFCLGLYKAAVVEHRMRIELYVGSTCTSSLVSITKHPACELWSYSLFLRILFVLKNSLLCKHNPFLSQSSWNIFAYDLKKHKNIFKYGFLEFSDILGVKKVQYAKKALFFFFFYTYPYFFRDHYNLFTSEAFKS